MCQLGNQKFVIYYTCSNINDLSVSMNIRMNSEFSGGVVRGVIILYINGQLYFKYIFKVNVNSQYDAPSDNNMIVVIKGNYATFIIQGCKCIKCPLNNSNITK